MRTRQAIGYATCRHCRSLYVTRRTARPSDRCCRASTCRRLEHNDRLRRFMQEWTATHGEPYTARYTAARRQAAGVYRVSQRGKDARAAADLRRRAHKTNAAVVESVRPMDVHDRDGWLCGICSQPIDPGLSYPHPDSASVDHIVPLSTGGDHSMANVRSAHWICNVRRGTRASA